MNLAFLCVATIILYITARANYLLFHALVEGFAIVVAALIYTLATRTYQHSRNDTFLFLGIAYLHVGILDFVHTLVYKGMGVFPGFGSDTPTQLWIAGRFMEAVSLFVILFLPGTKVNRKLTALVYALVTAALLLSIMVYPVFPVCFVENEGLTTFKVASEYVIMAILILSAYILHRRKKDFDLEVVKSVGIAMIITAAAELAFTLYTDVYGIANMLGHLLKVVSYYFIFSGVVAQGIDAPYSVISSELKRLAVTDDLTGLLNRKGMVQAIEKELELVAQEETSLGILLIDFDDFKQINDKHGHLFGDKTLAAFASLLKSVLDEESHACRFGGDEFVVLARNLDTAALSGLKDRIQGAVKAWIAEDERLAGLGVSIGTGLLEVGQSSDTDNLLKIADQSMYAAKRSKTRLQMIGYD